MVDVFFNTWDNGGLNNSRSIDTSDPTYVIVHGFQSTGGNPGNNFTPQSWMSEMAQNIRDLEGNDANILLVDWQEGANTLNYFAAADRVDDVGVEVADYLLSQGVNPTDTTLIGHSLGAHVMGEAGEEFRERSGEVDQLIGLDPAGPEFEGGWFSSANPTDDRLDPSDADRVVAFHTSSTLGYDDPLADLDVYINWDDLFQPGSFSFVGNHSYAHTLYNDLLDGFTFPQSDDTTLSLSTINGNTTGSVFVDTFAV
ncbi:MULTISPECIES: alpha/beta fold hydrolase [Okeania]|uniref:Alpha/beta fold hydrolase n=1 Tax=Okeania hirsuta TaxID=1458930 RepID=A0A3N6PWJ9_9CYAN|nr:MULTISPECIES: alpha/beta fold hydrolase [Okeania]NET16011.1 alpha/beta fold hydrolase [Okeania sp. SIO1H6]NES77714.1 alpha/beta fold hydrolase [Okeania sp. SIO1H4]NES88916.1 alpha/beta fold hydrolase [Okeania sp. SIO2B9]NET21360.1 alpha/beta fold hydrolase [Okeania sp. SIO1H5]NET78035.1 alpha/beta fold hydrolase [Okeania sp. SIO1F9]